MEKKATELLPTKYREGYVVIIYFLLIFVHVQDLVPGELKAQIPLGHWQGDSHTYSTHFWPMFLFYTT